MQDKIVRLVEFIVREFAENQEEISITVEEKEDQINIVVTASATDMGKIIGKQGRIAKSIRTIVKSVSSKEKKTYFVEIRDQVAAE